MIPERLVIPFSAIKSFFDPSVQFGLQFEPVDEPTAEAEAPVETLPVTAAPETPAEAGDEPVKQGEGAEVVRLDRFRKK